MYNQNYSNSENHQQRNTIKKEYVQRSYNNDKNNSAHKNPYNTVQHSTNSYAYHQHAYDISAYAQIVAGGRTPEEALSALEFFYKNLFRLEGAENK